MYNIKQYLHPYALEARYAMIGISLVKESLTRQQGLELLALTLSLHSLSKMISKIRRPT